MRQQNVKVDCGVVEGSEGRHKGRVGSNLGVRSGLKVSKMGTGVDHRWWGSKGQGSRWGQSVLGSDRHKEWVRSSQGWGWWGRAGLGTCHHQGSRG